MITKEQLVRDLSDMDYVLRHDCDRVPFSYMDRYSKLIRDITCDYDDIVDFRFREPPTVTNLITKINDIVRSAKLAYPGIKVDMRISGTSINLEIYDIKDPWAAITYNIFTPIGVCDDKICQRIEEALRDCIKKYFNKKGKHE